MIFEQYNTVFFHVPKTAGFAMEAYFAPYKRDWRVFNEEIVYGWNGEMFTQHITYSDMLKYRSQEFLDSQFKFSFFRNTWDRFASAFFYLEQEYLKNHVDFADFVEKTCEKVKVYKENKGWHFAKQTDWLFKEDGTIALDYIGLYENIDEDFKNVCNLIGAEHKPLKKLNYSKNSSLNYRDLYTDKLMNLVKEAYSEEIAFFDFKF